MPYSITTKDGITIQNIPDDVPADSLQLKERIAKIRSQGASAPKPQEPKMDPTDGMSPLDKFMAGLGKSVYDTGRGLKQLGAEAGNMVGLVSDNTVGQLRAESDQIKAQDAALMDSGWGMAGNVTGQVGQAFLPGGIVAGAGKLAGRAGLQMAGRAMAAAPSTVPGIAAGFASGAAQGAVQPVGTDDSRTLNSLTGGIGGALVPTAGLMVGVGREMFRPATQAGREVIVGRAINRAAGPNASAVQQRLTQARELVPGAMPTVGDVAESGGVAALQRGASAVDPELYAAREVAKLDAWRAALSDIAGDSGKKAAANSARDSATKALYSQADMGFAPVDPMFTGLLQRPAVRTAVATAQKNAKNSGLDDIFFRDAKGAPVGLLGQGGHFIKKALDDASDAAMRAGKKEASRGVLSTRDEFINWLEGHIPEYGVARQEFARLSQPINQMEVGDELLKALNPASVQFGRMGGMKAETFSGAVANAPKTIKTATGQNAKALSDVLTPAQAQTVDGVARDVARTLNAQNLGRGVGSNTAQNLGMSNLLEASGLPMGILNAPIVGPAMGALGKIAPSEQALKGLLAEAMLDPKKAAALMKAAEEAANTLPSKAGRALSYTSRPLLQGLLSSQLAQ